MSEDDPTTELVNAATRFVIGAAYGWTAPKAPPQLNAAYAKVTGRLLDGRAQFLNLMRYQIAKDFLQSIPRQFDVEGRPTSDAARSWVKQKRHEYERDYLRLPTILLAAMGKPGLLADFNAWEKMAHFNLDEALWLSVGLEPEPFVKSIEEAPRGATIDDRPADFMRRRREQFRRGLNPTGFQRVFRPELILNWIDDVSLEVHPGFQAMLDNATLGSKRKIVTPDTEPQEQQEVEVSRVDQREVSSVSVLLLAMAIDHYGYDPNAGRSKVPKEIQDMAATLGFELSQDTILKYLRIGAKRLPKDWEPKP